MAENIPARPQRNRPPTGPAAVEQPPAPGHLSPDATARWDRIVNEWVLDEPALMLLAGALEQWDAYQAYRATVAAEGGTFRTEGGMVRAHPAAKLALDSFAAFRMAMRQLGLEPAE